MVVIFLPTSIIIIFCYAGIWRVSRAHHANIQASISDKATAKQQKNFKAIFTLVIIVGAFYVAWIPFIVEHLIKAFHGSLENVPQWTEITMLFTTISNSFWNPLIYLGTNQVFRKAGLQLFSCMCCKTKVRPAETSVEQLE